MKKILKWIGIVLAVLLGLVVIVLAVFFFKGNAMVTHRYTVSVETVPLPTDAASIARGQHFVKAICSECHLSDLSGQNLLNAPFATVDSANLTSSPTGAGSTFKDADWVRAIRHGVDDQGRSLIIMPAQEFWYFNDQDLGDIIAYVKSVPPVDKHHDDPHMNVMGKIMAGAGLFGKDLVPASVINHTQRPPAPPIGVTVPYGEYLVNVTGCHDCHGPQLAGGKSAKPGALDAPNLTPGGDLKAWSQAQFIQTLHTGVKPDGKQLKPTEMPWKSIGTYSDDELSAIFMYLQTLPALPTVKP
jgi:mono/diheme cytochrome c family protein